MGSEVLRRFAIDYIRRARARLVGAEAALARGDYPEIVRYSQECVELSLKAALRFTGIEYPRVHDVSDVLVENADRFPKWFRRIAGELVLTSSKLALARGPSVYGDEERGIPPGELFDRQDAERALRDARRVLDVCSRLIGGSGL